MSLLKRGQIDINPLAQLTCVIPFRNDSRQRSQNLSAVAGYLTELGCTVVVAEYGVRQHAPEAVTTRSPKCSFHFHSDVEPLFHHTRARNQAAYSVRTPLLALWDADIVIPRLQLVWSATRLLERVCDYAFPFDGRFVDFARHAMAGHLSGAMRQVAFATRPPHVDENRDGRVTVMASGRKLTGRTATRKSVGGAVLFWRDVFMEGGMENEAFVSYGPEDQERDVRFRKLGFVSCRAEGLLYHLTHPRGLNSDDGHSFTATNRVEFRRIKKLSRACLTAEIAEWSWTKPPIQRFRVTS
jgi:hypothetical protein